MANEHDESPGGPDPEALATDARTAPSGSSAGIHHVTAVASDPQQNLDFYLGVLGLRLVKRTVNFDDPGTYHFYYGGHRGGPGTVLTFFPWPGAGRGTVGRGQVTRVELSVPDGSLPFWTERLAREGVDVGSRAGSGRGPGDRIEFADPDGLPLALGTEQSEGERPAEGERPVEGERPADASPSAVPAEHAIQAIGSVTLSPRVTEGTLVILEEVLGFRPAPGGDTQERRRLSAARSEGPGRRVDVVGRRDAPGGRGGTGTVHHVAWRARDQEQQRAWREALLEEGLQVTPVIDRHYFRSIYFREPGGILFEIATDRPGFTVDEPEEGLPGPPGGSLRLPPWLEERRDEIEASLPAVTLPDADPGAGS